MIRSFKLLSLVLALPFLSIPCQAAESSYSWDAPSPVGPKTVFFGELQDRAKSDADRPKRGDKGYAWYYLEKGNKHFLGGEFEKAETSYREAYSVPGSTRVISGFKLVEALQRSGRTDDALETLDGLEKKYLVSAREFGEARSVRSALLDEKRKNVVKVAPAAFTGRDWVMELSAWRVRFVLEGMETLRAFGIPLKESYQGYVFLLDDHFLAHPEEDASDPAKVLAALVYERDSASRNLIDLWRADPSKIPAVTPVKAGQGPEKITGAEWITMTHRDKMEYTAGAMAVLRDQRVPMNRSLYSYVDALDGLFTETPELPASDSVAALASFLYDTEPEARQVLEALRLE